jgi:hypothetical protein
LVSITAQEVELLKHQPDYLRFDRQRLVKDDPSSLIALFCSRRAGKTEEFVFETAERLVSVDDAHVVFIGLSAKSARNIFYAKFKRLSIKHGWGFEFNETTLSIKCERTGSVCLVFGSDNRADVEKILGLSRLVLLICDECGAWRQDFLQYTIEQVAGPAMEDLPGGRVLLGGTPGREHFGFWYDLTTRALDPKTGQLLYPGYSIHSWTLDDNPYMPRGVLAKVRERYGWSETTPAFVQGYLGRWCLDTSTLVFHTFTNANLAVRDKSESVGRRVLALDFGVVHATSFVVLEVRSQGVHVPWSVEARGLAPTQVADRIIDLKKKWRFDAIVGDLGGMGKAYAAEMSVRYGVEILPADKRDKLALIEFVVSGFKDGTLTLDPVQALELVRQVRSLQYDDEHLDIAAGQKDDSVDALTYGYQYITGRQVFASRYDKAFAKIGV